jgi:hypothetical protein
MSYYSAFFLESLKSVLQRLVNRDMRLKLFPSDFWVIDTHLEGHSSEMKLKKIAKFVSPTVLMNCPHCYSFEIRAKVFTYDLAVLKEETSYHIYNSGSEITIRRDYIIEDAFD